MYIYTCPQLVQTPLENNNNTVTDMLPGFQRTEPAASSSSSTHSSPSQLPYLRDSDSPDAQPLQKQHEDEERARDPTPTPSSFALLNLPGPSSGSAKALLSPTLSATSSTSTSSKGRTRKRPAPLILGRQNIGQDEELTAQLEADGRWSARSPLTVISRRSSGHGESSSTSVFECCALIIAD